MTKSKIRVSLVIPAYNEESYLRPCLEAAAAQDIPFFEIIVVDNNSTDKTAEIARTFPGVRVVGETRQGKVYARNAGFTAARGDIIARIDADTILPPEWNGTLQDIFAESDTDAVSGRPYYYDLALPQLSFQIEGFFRRRLAHELREALFLQGANMAVRREAWAAVQHKLCNTRTIHEDFDIAIHLQELGYKVTYEDRLVAMLSARCLDVSFGYFLSYIRINPHTYAVHDVPHYRRMYPVLFITAALFLPARTLLRGRHPITGRFSLTQLLTRAAAISRADAAAVSNYLS
jgi:cellulose synthase/poly-beta-1,6-N-acetylglucosamine synthase-like glycosyltransferase